MHNGGGLPRVMAGSVGSDPEQDCEVSKQWGTQNMTTSTFANNANPSSPVVSQPREKNETLDE